MDLELAQERDILLYLGVSAEDLTDDVLKSEQVKEVSKAVYDVRNQLVHDGCENLLQEKLGELRAKLQNLLEARKSSNRIQARTTTLASSAYVAAMLGGAALGTTVAVAFAGVAGVVAAGGFIRQLLDEREAKSKAEKVLNEVKEIGKGAEGLSNGLEDAFDIERVDSGTVALPEGALTVGQRVSHTQPTVIDTRMYVKALLLDLGVLQNAARTIGMRCDGPGVEMLSLKAELGFSDALLTQELRGTINDKLIAVHFPRSDLLGEVEVLECTTVGSLIDLIVAKVRAESRHARLG